MKTPIPSLKEFVEKIEDLINVEQESITGRLSKLSTIANLLEERSNLTLNENRLNISPLTDQEKEENIHIMKVNSIQPAAEKENVELNAFDTTKFTSSVIVINSQDVLEKLIIKFLNSMTLESFQGYVAVTNLATELNKVCGQSANSIVKKLKLGSNFTKFLESCPTFKLHKTGKQYNVAIGDKSTTRSNG